MSPEDTSRLAAIIGKPATNTAAEDAAEAEYYAYVGAGKNAVTNPKPRTQAGVAGRL